MLPTLMRVFCRKKPVRGGGSRAGVVRSGTNASGSCPLCKRFACRSLSLSPLNRLVRRGLTPLPPPCGICGGLGGGLCPCFLCPTPGNGQQQGWLAPIGCGRRGSLGGSGAALGSRRLLREA